MMKTASLFCFIPDNAFLYDHRGKAHYTYDKSTNKLMPNSLEVTDELLEGMELDYLTIQDPEIIRQNGKNHILNN